MKNSISNSIANSNKNILLNPSVADARINTIIASIAKGQIFDTKTAKYMVTFVDETSMELTQLKAGMAIPKTRTLTNPKTGEKITQSYIDNTPVLTTDTRNYSKKTFATMLLNKNFEQTKLAYTESHLS